jgi:hypothetical protein
MATKAAGKSDDQDDANPESLRHRDVSPAQSRPKQRPMCIAITVANAPSATG